MTAALLVVILVALAVALSAARPSPTRFPATDRDRERQLTELRALRCARADLRLP